MRCLTDGASCGPSGRNRPPKPRQCRPPGRRCAHTACHVAPQAPAQARARGRFGPCAAGDPRPDAGPGSGAIEDAGDTARRPFRLGETLPVLLVKAAHPKQAVLTALGLAIAAGIAGRPLREIGLVVRSPCWSVRRCSAGTTTWSTGCATSATSWPASRSAAGCSSPARCGSAWRARCSSSYPSPSAPGRVPARAYLIALLIGLIGNRVLRGSVLSFLPWVLQFGLYPAYLAYGGWNGVGHDTPPTVEMTVLAGAARARRPLPACAARPGARQPGRPALASRCGSRSRPGHPGCCVLSVVFTGAIVVALLIAGQAVGLT